MKYHNVAKAAIRINDSGLIYEVERPGRHSDVIFKMASDGIPIPIGAEPEYTQGFTLDDGRFVTRWEARIHATRSGQIEATKWGNELYSEDLW
jgi:hypothetical protein